MLSGEQRDSPAALAGVAIGIVGVGMLLGVDAAARDAIAGGLMVITAAFGYAVAAWYLANLAGVEPVATVAGTQPWPRSSRSRSASRTSRTRAPALDAVASLLTLGIVCTGIAFVIFHSLVASDGPSRASLVGYIAPVFSIFYGVVLLDESFTGSDRGRARADPGRLLAGGGRRAARTPPRCRGRGEPHGGPDAVLLEDGPNAAIASRPEPL